MHPRQKELFNHIVEEYIKTAEPVGSKLIVEKFNWDISAATIRNDMMELEEADLIFQLHISSGRVPTECGYQQYIKENVNLNGELIEKERNEILKHLSTEALKGNDQESKMKFIARILAEKSGLGVVVGFSKNNVYYTGLSNLFSQPEFQDLNLVCSLSNVIDHLDEIMEYIYDKISQETEIKIGCDNYFAKNCATVMVKSKNAMFGILGPMRMNYQRNVELINFVKSII